MTTTIDPHPPNSGPGSDTAPLRDGAAARSTGLILGVDPALCSAVALYDPLSQRITAMIDMPVLVRVKRTNVSQRREISAVTLKHEIVAGLAGPRRPGCDRSGHRQPADGVSSAFSFGVWSLPLTGRWKFVIPVAWKRALRIRRGSTKDESRVRAS
jgi:hypothetical protein